MGKYPLRLNRVQHIPVIIRAIGFLLFVAASMSAFNDLGLPMLPVDENDGLRMLHDGAIDSSLWNTIREFYTAPIIVPRGELAILQDLFFSLPDDLPVTESALTDFEPWGPNERKRFFERFPDLEPFAPILSFESHSAAVFPGQTAFYFSRQGLNDSSEQYVVFSVGEKRNINGSGRIDFSDSYGRWRRRVIDYEPRSCCHTTIGNYAVSERTKLFYGYFPSLGTGDTSIADNWLYSRSNTWNGVRFRYGSPLPCGKIAVNAYIHDRPSERIGLIESDLYYAHGFGLYAAASYLQTSEAAIHDQHYYLHVGVSWKAGAGWNGALNTGLEATVSQTKPPFLAEVSHRNSQNQFRGRITYLPEGFSAPRSKLLMMAEERGLYPDSLHQSILSTDLSWSHRIGSFFTATQEINGIFTHNGLYYSSCSIGLSGAVPFPYFLRYSWSPIDEEEDSDNQLHQMALSFTLRISDYINVDLMHSTRHRQDGFFSNRIFCSPSLRLSPAFCIAPVAIISCNSNGGWRYAAGLKQILTLREKTLSEFKIEQDMPFSSWEKLRAQGRMSFLF